MIKGKQNFVKSQPAIYDIGTEILFLPCFATTDMFLFCKKLIFSGIATPRPVDKDSGVKTPFWAIIKKTQKFVKAVSAQIGFRPGSAQIGSKLYRLKSASDLYRLKAVSA